MSRSKDGPPLTGGSYSVRSPNPTPPPLAGVVATSHPVVWSTAAVEDGFIHTAAWGTQPMTDTAETPEREPLFTPEQPETETPKTAEEIEAMLAAQGWGIILDARGLGLNNEHAYQGLVRDVIAPYAAAGGHEIRIAQSLEEGGILVLARRKPLVQTLKLRVDASEVLGGLAAMAAFAEMMGEADADEREMTLDNAHDPYAVLNDAVNLTRLGPDHTLLDNLRIIYEDLSDEDFQHTLDGLAERGLITLNDSSGGTFFKVSVRGAIIGVLSQFPCGMKAARLATRTGVDQAQIEKTLTRLVEEGVVSVDDEGVYNLDLELDD